jgi:predicted transcriptional regulator
MPVEVSMKKKAITAKDFKVMDGRFGKGVAVARALDAGEPMPDAVRITASSPEQFFTTMTPKRMALFRLTRKCAQSIAELAVASRRDRSAVARDVSQLEVLGLVRVVDQPNPGHGRKKVVEPVAKHIEVVTEF